MITPFDEDIKDLCKASRVIGDEINAQTKELRTKKYKLNEECHRLESKKNNWIRQQKSLCNKGGSGGYMNLIFFWEDGTRFDSGKQKRFIDFKDMVFAKGLPTSFEVRG